MKTVDLRKTGARNGYHQADAETNRIPPNDPMAEKAVLGCMLMDPAEAIPAVVQKIGSNAEVFYELRHQELFKILVEMFDAQETIDLVTLHSWVELRDMLEPMGGIAYLASLSDAAPSASAVSQYLEIVQAHYRSRKAIQVCTEVSSGIFNRQGEPDALVEFGAQGLMDLAETTVVEEEIPMNQLVHRAINTIEACCQNQGALTGLSSGFSDFDKMTTGLHGGEMIVIAGRPGQGKTTFALNLAEHVALDLHLPVGVFSLEMTKENLVLKMLCSRARVNLRNLTQGYLAERDLPKLTNAAGKLHTAPVHINDIGGLSILGLRTRARRMHRQHGIKLLVIDYLQLLSAERKRQDSRQQEVSDISLGIKNLAKELDVPVVVLSQLNRGVEKEKGRKPQLSDLRESGSIEQDADLVGFLYRPRSFDEEENQDDNWSCPVNLEIAKQRNGPTGVIPMTFMKAWSRFELQSKASEEPVTEPAQAELPVSDQE